ncbi:hypothetical protein DBV15_06238, partial [Temnothorax longispinosus]
AASGERRDAPPSFSFSLILSLVLESFPCTFFQRSKVTLPYNPYVLLRSLGRSSDRVAIIPAGEARERFCVTRVLIPQVCHSWSANTHVSAARMARGQQKIQSQAKAAEKSAKLKKQQGHSANDQKKAAQKALVHVCTVCKAQMPDPKTYKQHFENKHPKNELPDDLKNI